MSDAPDVYTWMLSYIASTVLVLKRFMILLQRVLDSMHLKAVISVDRCARDKKCPFNDVTVYGGVWRKDAEK